MLPKDYVRFRLTGERAIDMADASGTLMLDVARRTWSAEVLGKTGIDRALLPRFVRVSAGVRETFCWRRGGDWIERRHSGRGRRGRSGGRSALGWGSCVPEPSAQLLERPAWYSRRPIVPALDPQGRLHTFCHAIPQRWHVMGVTQAAGLSLRWFRDNFGAGPDDGRDPYERLAEEAATAPAGSNGVLWAPYLMGERTPHLDPNARAALVGLSASHTRAHVIRAILEGVAFSLRDSFTIFAEMKVPVHRIRLGGGGAGRTCGGRFRRTSTGHAVEIVTAEEGAAYGAAILAGVGAGRWKSVDEACDAVVTDRSAGPAESARLCDAGANISLVPQDISGIAPDS